MLAQTVSNIAKLPGVCAYLFEKRSLLFISLPFCCFISNIIFLCRIWIFSADLLIVAEPPCLCSSYTPTLWSLSTLIPCLPYALLFLHSSNRCCHFLIFYPLLSLNLLITTIYDTSFGMLYNLYYIRYR
jgi:hypothetical protein